MAKKNVKGGKAHKKKKNDSQGNDLKSDKKVDFKSDDQQYGQVTKLLGNCRLEVACFDGVARLCHIRGSMRKKVWISVNDVVLVSLRDFEDAKGDIIYKYDIPEINYLKKENEIPYDVKLYEEFEENPKDIGFEFGKDDDDEDSKVEELTELDIDNI